MPKSNSVFVCALSLTVSLFLCLSIANAAEEGLAAYWSMDEGKGNIVKDLSENGNDGTAKGGYEWVEGVSGTALLFDGAGWVDCGSDKSITLPQHSCMFWMRPSRDLGANDPRMNILYYAGGPMFALNVAQGGAIKKPGSITAWGGGWGYSKKTSWDKDVWYHLARVLGGGQHIFYVNGEENDKVGAGSAGGFKSAFGIGAANGGGGFSGTVDEVKLYSRALTPEEVGREYRKVTAVEAGAKLASTWGDIRRGLLD